MRWPSGKICALSMLIGLAQSPAADPPRKNRIAGPPNGPWRRLFLDAMVVERSQNLKRVFHAATPNPRNPVLPFEKPWEGDPERGSGPYLYGTVMWDQGKLRMWYHCYHRAHGSYFNLYAESTDGLVWTKPSLGLIEFDGSTDNNLIITRSPPDAIEAPDLYRGGGKCHNPSVIKCPGKGTAEPPYELFCYSQEYRHARRATSADGLRWVFDPATAGKALFPSGDVLNFFFDPYGDRYVATCKTGNRRGRAAGIATSPDGKIWSKPVPGAVMGADDLDPDATQIYGMPVFPYQGMYIGLPWVYNARWFKHGSYTDQKMYKAEKSSPCTMDCQLAWSWDLINWTRPPERTPFIPRGKPGQFDSHMVYTARAPVQMGDELWFYYGGFDAPHNDSTANAAVGVAALRLDGFASMTAGATEGWLVSRTERLMVPRITINARARRNGYVTAEILGPDGTTIPGFSRNECAAFKGDSVEHVLTWKQTEFKPEHLTELKHIRFFLKQADLYSYMPDLSTPAAAIKPANVIYDPSQNGGMLPNDKRIPEDRRFRLTGSPEGYSIVKSEGRIVLDMHSAAARKTSAACSREHTWTDNTNWCLEAWMKVVDPGDQPNYGLAMWMRPDAPAKGIAVFISATHVGFNSSQGLTKHLTLRKVPFDTTDRLHWYRMVHTGGTDGTISLLIDGDEICTIPMSDVLPRTGSGANILFGPNASSREGRVHIAKFGYRIRDTKALFGPIEAK